MKQIKKTNDYTAVLFTVCSMLAVLVAVWTFTGKWPWLYQPYNSYILQAQSWLSGRLDLGQNYSHLEIAVFNGKYYISFPPFPSFVMLPFVAMGFDTCDGFIALVSALLGGVYAFRILRQCGFEKNTSVFFSLFLTVASNWLFTAQTAWVWFIAQNMAFTLSLMAIYYALKGRMTLSLAFWACAVGCRPLQIFYLPILLYLLYESFKNEKLSVIIRKKWICVIPMGIIALSYMILNFARFGNPLEFGHNYLPEFTEAEFGQFNVVYIFQNIHSLIRLPKISFDGAWEYQAFNGTNMFLISPIFISAVVYGIKSIFSKSTDKKLVILIFIMAILEILAITAHKTMGGSQFGNRYTNDILPMMLILIALSLPKKDRVSEFNYVLFFIGITVNVIGSVLYYMG